MAKFLVSGIPAFGLVNPVLPLVAELTAAGHDVDVLLSEHFRGAVEAAGATLVPYAFQLEGPLTSPWSLASQGRRIFDDMTAAMIRLGNRYDALIGAGMQPRLDEVERALDRPVALHLPVFFQNDRTAGYFAQICTTMPQPARRVLGTPALRRVAGQVAGRGVFGRAQGDIIELLGPRSRSLNMTVAARDYQPFAEDFDGLYLGPRPTQRREDPSFPMDRVRDHDGPVIYATLGTVFNSWVPFFRTIADAFDGSDALVVMTTGSQARVSEVGVVPQNVILRPFVPQTMVLEQADVCFTHGGFGTATDAVGLGVVPVLTPMGADQFFNAHRLEALEAGLVLPRAEFTVESVRVAAERARTEADLQAGVARMRAAFVSSPGPVAGVRALEALV
ncbi:nucleotide disphospho-sugar-binding domain-containing protein [Luteococcus sp. Sow4_B9]|uniref:nucleotide disphospho-sugar-binding domain-containing protein n=1 Tax=Luteococcus sp. Sow4_B9 TaxID=3438792 RepID=UPI003F9634C2